MRVGCPSDDTVRNCTLRRIRMSGYNGIYFDNPVAYLSKDNEGFVDVHDMVFEDFSGTVRNYALQATVAPGIRIRGIRNCLFRNFDVHSSGAPRFIGNVWSKFENMRHENFRFNGELLPDGEFVGDFTNDKTLKRRTKKIDNSRAGHAAEAAPAKETKREGDVSYVAHAGEEYYAPDHSKAAYRIALEHGLDILKFDLHPTKDGQIVCNHDNTLENRMLWNVRIHDVTLDEIRQRRFRSRGGYTNETIVTLAEALEFGLKAKKGVWLDFKEFSPKFFEQAIAECDKAGLPHERIMVATWTVKAIEYCRDRHPDVRRVMHTGIRPPDDEHKGWRLNYTKKGPPKTFEFATEEEVAAELIAQRKDLGLYGFNIPVDIIRRNRLIYRTPDSVFRALKADGAWLSMWFVEDEETGEWVNGGYFAAGTYTDNKYSVGYGEDIKYFNGQVWILSNGRLFAFNPDGTFTGTCFDLTRDRSIVPYNPDSMGFSYDGRYIYTCYGFIDKTHANVKYIYRTDVATGVTMQFCKSTDGYMYDRLYSLRALVGLPDGRLAVSCRDGNLLFALKPGDDPTSGGLFDSDLWTNVSSPQTMYFDRRARKLYLSGFSNRLYCWDYATGAKTQKEGLANIIGITGDDHGRIFGTSYNSPAALADLLADNGAFTTKGHRLILNGGLNYHRCCFFDTKPPASTVIILR